MASVAMTMAPSTTATADVIIIGGGVIGCSLAEALAGEGLGVTLLERGLIGREASWAAAGMLAPQSEMPEPGPYFDFCLASRRLYPAVIERLRETTGIDPQYRDEGMLYAAFGEEEAAVIETRARWQQALGVGARLLTREAALELEPNLSPAVARAVVFEEDHQLDPRLLTQAYAIAARRQGARLRECCPVGRALIEGGRVVGVECAGERVCAGAVVLAGGCWSHQVEGVRPAPPTYPVKGQVILLQARAPLFEHVLHSARVYLAPRRDGRVVVGATEEHEAGFDKTIQAGALGGLLREALALAPPLAEAAWVDAWAGLRPGTPDRRPILGRHPIEGLFLATGHFRNGILLAPMTARLMATLIATGRLPEALRPFGMERFLGGERAAGAATAIA